MADVITTLHPEGMPEDDLYPNIKKENLPSTLQPVADFALSEYEKTLNLWTRGYNSVAYTDDIYWIGSGSGVKVQAGETYTISFNTAKSFTIYFYDNDSLANLISTQSETLSQSLTFTAPSGCGAIIVNYTRDGSDISRVMLNKGLTALPFVDYNGSVMHAVDVEGVLLWKNANPGAGFPASNITLGDRISNYSKITVTFRPYYTLGTIERTFVPLERTSQIDCVSVLSSENIANCRQITVISDTELRIASNYTNQQVDNNRCVPVAIYGIK